MHGCAVLDASTFPYGVGQGALGIETRAGDLDVIRLVQAVVHAETSLRCRAERAFMRRLEGGCQVPIGVRSSVEAGRLVLDGTVMSVDGSLCIQVRALHVVAWPIALRVMLLCAGF